MSNLLRLAAKLQLTKMLHNLTIHIRQTCRFSLFRLLFFLLKKSVGNQIKLSYPSKLEGKVETSKSTFRSRTSIIYSKVDSRASTRKIISTQSVYNTSPEFDGGCRPEATLPALRKAKTCLRFPLDGRAFVANLHMNTNLLRISNLVMHVWMKDFPPSKVPTQNSLKSRKFSEKLKRVHFNVIGLLSMVDHEQKKKKKQLILKCYGISNTVQKNRQK